MGKEQVNVLITGGGGPGYPLFYKALKQSSRYQVRTVATEINRFAGNLFRRDWVDTAYLTGRNDDPAFIDEISEIVRRESIDFLYSGIDEELPIFARHRERLAELGCRLVLPPAPALEMAFDKWMTYDRLQGIVSQPETMRITTDSDFDPHAVLERFDGRVKVKGARTRGNRLNFLAESADDLVFYSNYLMRSGHEFIVQQYIVGREFNVSVMLDNDGEALYAVCREKLDDEQKRPNTNAGCIVRHAEMEAAALRVAQETDLFPGCSNVEFLMDDTGRFYVIDVNGGRHAAQDYNLIHCGINIPEMLIDMSRGEAPDKIEDDRVKDGIICIKYLDEVIVEMDDLASHWKKLEGQA